MIVYRIQNKINEKSYIGWTSKTLEIRWNQHKKKSLNTDTNTKFYNAIRKYGTDVWEVQILCEVEDKSRAKELEIEYIKIFDCYYNGYNSTIGGDGNNMIVMSIESNKKRSEKLKGVKKPIGFNLGRKHSEETKNKISKSHLNKRKPWVRWSDEQIIKRSLKRRSLNKEQYDLIHKLRKDGLTTKNISNIVGVSNDIVKKWIHKEW